jgi:alpha-L-rhamnosidase
VHGKIESAWKKANGAFQWELALPANTVARVYVPAVSEDKVHESGVKAASAEGVKFIEQAGGYAVYEVGSGVYSFSSSL